MNITQTEQVGPLPEASIAVALLDDGKPGDRSRNLMHPLKPPLLPLALAATSAGPGAQPSAANGASPLALAVCGGGDIDWRIYVQCLRRADPGPWAGILTRREARVAAGLLACRTDAKDVSRRFPIEGSTFHRYTMRIYRKLGVHTLEDARRELRRRI